jgi:hypothetical protein
MQQDDRFTTDTRTPFERFVEKRKVGLSAVVLFFVAQLLYGHFYCSTGAMSFLIISAFVLLPGMVIFIKWQTNWALPTYAVTLFLFCIWANNAECAPYTGGGAAMAYVVVFLFGVPISFLAGLCVGKIAESEQAGKDQK